MQYNTIKIMELSNTDAPKLNTQKLKKRGSTNQLKRSNAVTNNIDLSINR